MRQIILAGLAALLVSCGSQEQPASEPNDLDIEDSAPVAALADIKPVIEKLEPISLDGGQRAELLQAFAVSERAARVLRRKSETGHVDPNAGGSIDLAEAEKNLERVQMALAEMSTPEIPSFLLLHRISPDRKLTSWLIGAQGVIAFDQSAQPYLDLDFVEDGLGVTRLATTRAARRKGERAPTRTDKERALREDRTPASRAKRRATLVATRDMVMPGSVGEALGRLSGRLLIVGAEETGTAPYAALPLDNGIAAKNWAFVNLPDIKTLASEDATFDHAAVNLSNAVIVGDPDLSRDPEYDWDPLPGARDEAGLVAKQFGISQENVLLGKQATQNSLRRSINRMSGDGLVYIASHAVADPKNPLTRGFVAMAGEHYYAGYIRQERFRGWDEHEPLVVVSACQTALGRVLDGGGFGVTQSWYKAGAGQVVGSLWNVSDPATLVLMHYFTKKLGEGAAPEFAMQYAQLKTMTYRNRKSGDQPFLDDPKMWASFSIYGKPSRDPAR